mmetsp:Transcript_28840/g.65998  ORF Transcript_28840/g.65998 Transcript_28840/m.65998 type:complete len:260 (-) Transcript_28840:1254-2033(-)
MRRRHRSANRRSPPLKTRHRRLPAERHLRRRVPGHHGHRRPHLQGRGDHRCARGVRRGRRRPERPRGQRPPDPVRRVHVFHRVPRGGGGLLRARGSGNRGAGAQRHPLFLFWRRRGGGRVRDAELRAPRRGVPVYRAVREGSDTHLEGGAGHRSRRRYLLRVHLPPDRPPAPVYRLHLLVHRPLLPLPLLRPRLRPRQPRSHPGGPGISGRRGGQRDRHEVRRRGRLRLLRPRRHRRRPPLLHAAPHRPRDRGHPRRGA